MLEKQDLLIEIGTEELPPKELNSLIKAFEDNILKQFTEAELSFEGSKAFATPRRLAIQINNLISQQANRFIERKGPSLQAAFDPQGNPTKAGEGFARSCGIPITALEKQETPDGSWLIYRYEESGKSLSQLLPSIIEKALIQLPSKKTMRWGNKTTSFIRPLHWIVLLYGSEIINTEIFGIKTSNITYGHRFHCPTPLTLQYSKDYEEILEKKGKVIADSDKRQAMILQGIENLAQSKNAIPHTDPGLLTEINALVEWPIPLIAEFDENFLNVPKEALISAIQNHQKCIPLSDTQGKLLPYFITISNIDSQKPQEVIIGNERVMRARLSDAAFFYQMDLKTSLAERNQGLEKVLFQEKLGTVFQKTLRIAKLSQAISPFIPNSDTQKAYEAGLLCKADLLSGMVGEFPELQGIMGSYYAQAEGKSENIALAIREHYLPRNAYDDIPHSPEGKVLALADRLDSLIGLFGIQQPPTGDKDPFGLRRAAIAIINILRHTPNLSLTQLLTLAYQGFQEQCIELVNKNVINEVKIFILDRLPHLGLYPTSFVKAVLAVENDNLNDIETRIKAIKIFCEQQNTNALVEVNKRIHNLLSKTAFISPEIKQELFEFKQEKELYDVIQQFQEKKVNTTDNHHFYQDYLESLAALQKPLDAFFEHVLVMVDNLALQQNRLALLNAIRNLFLRIADISLLQL